MERQVESESVGKASGWESVERELQSLIKDVKPARLKIASDMLRAAVKVAMDNYGTLNLKITTTVLKELRFSFKMFHPHRMTPKITMFGSARVPPGTPLYEFAKQFAMEAVRRKFFIITGGGPGIMQAGNEGAEAKAGFGLNIRLPVEQSANPFIDSENMLIHYKYFFTRKLFLVKEAAAFAFFPGGFGTFDEAFEVLTLLQTGKSSMIPVVMLEPKGFGFWTGVTQFLETNVLKCGFISETDKSLYRIFHSPKDAIDHIEQFYKNYHSMRLVKDKAVIRLRKTLSDSLLAKVNKDFAPAVSGGAPMKFTGPLPEESNEPELKDLVRLVFPFDRRDYGMLRRLIDFINENTV